MSGSCRRHSLHAVENSPVLWRSVYVMALIFSLVYGVSLASAMYVAFCIWSYKVSIGWAGSNGVFIILSFSVNAAAEIFPYVLKRCCSIVFFSHICITYGSVP